MIDKRPDTTEMIGKHHEASGAMLAAYKRLQTRKSHHSNAPYPSEQPRTYDEICAGTGYGEPFNAETFRKTTTPTVTAEFRDQRNTHFQQPGAVLMVYGLDPLRTNADKLFNLMCLYGNVAPQSKWCVQNLNNVAVGLTGAAPLSHHPINANDQQNDNNLKEHKLQLAFSKQPYLSEVTNPYPLPDKSPSYKEYITNKNNRFMNPAMASKNRIQPPSKILHFFNTPPQVTEVELIQVFRDYDVIPPKAVKLFPMKSERSKFWTSGV
ncbi:hypothetical protein NQ317_010520 [Molorchus minor]|uniref:Heterogeneous nuclear ribonucleoprotein L RRM domain-containing protein n=1 Tax=Molorchus minor TaxID=1323400 RepID=A0ABQ9JNV9_9CUCU|nr:hypothetical protein NQ317_010520 [Molorchus minor]